MEVNIFNTEVEIVQFNGDFPLENTRVFFKRKAFKKVESGTVYHYKTRCPKILIDGYRSFYVEFTDLEWWGKIK